MKYVKATLVSIVLGVLLDILISVMIPDRVMNVVFVLVASVLLLGILLVAFGTVTKKATAEV
jgi:cell division protein FtsW (lipid II flippase)